MLNQQRLKQLLDYNPDTGVMTWRASMRVAGCTRRDGYIAVGVDGKLYLLHRLAWLWMIGEFPGAHIDHKNRCKSDNSWINLRLATQSQNLANTIKPTKNKSGAKGVHWHPGSKRWRVQIGCRARREHIGMFDAIEAAAAAYEEAASKKYGEFARVK